MAEAAEQLVEGRGWLPPVLRTISGAAEPEDGPDGGDTADDSEGMASDDAYRFAAE